VGWIAETVPRAIVAGEEVTDSRSSSSWRLGASASALPMSCRSPLRRSTT
jgi:hypothetical protein